MTAADDPYRTLGLRAGASAAEIKRAYRQLALRYHPDLARSPDASARFQAVQAAYEALADPERKAEIDARLRARDARRDAPPWAAGDRGAGAGSAAPRGSAPADPDPTLLRDVREAIRDLLAAFGVAGEGLLDELIDALPSSVRESVREAIGPYPTAGIPGDGGFHGRPVRNLGGGEMEIDLELSPEAARAGATVPFRYHLGPHLVDERLRVPPGTRDGSRHTYSIAVGEDLTLRVTVCVRVRAGRAAV